MPNNSEIPRFRLQHTAGIPISDEAITTDMKRVATEHGNGKLSYRLYHAHGEYSSSTAGRRFGSWNKALTAAGLEVLQKNSIRDEDLFANLERMWIGLGRQPRLRDLSTAVSKYSEGPYIRRFGTWRRALEAFVEWAELSGRDSISDTAAGPDQQRRTPRDPNSALRWRVANRDSFRCQSCGRSPASHAGVALHIDHKVPWSKGGETTLENLQLLCDRCNLGKGTQDQTAG